MSPSRRRRAVAMLVDRLDLSQRRAGAIVASMDEGKTDLVYPSSTLPF